MSRNTLLIFPALVACPGEHGSVVLTRKFLDGVLEYTERWPGNVTVCLEQAHTVDSNLDHVAVHPENLPFTLEWMPRTQTELARRISHATLVLATLVDKHVHLAELCSAVQRPLVYITEYSVLTRRQIIRAETRNPLLRWRRETWTTELERRFVECVRAASGVQCNGTPTFEAYRKLNRRALLYFDTRVRQSQLAGTSVLQKRTQEMRAGSPLRLAYSGRLIAMKGADHLPRVAMELRRMGVDFTMNIFGDGTLAESMTQAIDKANLSNRVALHGVLDFAGELLPRVSRHVDLFVCCHRQGDPSCTYLETLSCGTPIIGYDNEALKGLTAGSGVGWTTPLDRPELLVRRIAELNQTRDLLAHAAFAARQFATGHTFETTMQIRIDHMLRCAQPLAMEAKAS